jgi:hypothetical protein
MPRDAAGDASLSRGALRSALLPLNAGSASASSSAQLALVGARNLESGTAGGMACDGRCENACAAVRAFAETRTAAATR